jgi:hypothetical protein
MSRADKLVPMGKLLNVIETAGFKVEYHYDDLVFIDNTSLMFRFDLEDFETVYLHFNQECAPQAKAQLTPFLMDIAKEETLKLEVSSDFSLSQKEGKEELEVLF